MTAPWEAAAAVVGVSCVCGGLIGALFGLSVIVAGSIEIARQLFASDVR